MGVQPCVTTRAKTRTSTCSAPARSSTRAQALAVAPEVITSSTRTSRRPAIRGRAASRHAEGALHVVRPLGAAEADLRNRRLDAHERQRVGGDAAGLRHRIGERRRLVEAAGEQAAAVQGDGNQKLPFRQKLGAGARHPAAHIGGQFQPVAVLEPVHEASRRAVLVARHRPGPGPDGRMGHDVGREQAVAEVVLERHARPLAERALDKWRFNPAFRAQKTVALDGGKTIWTG